MSSTRITYDPTTGAFDSPDADPTTLRAQTSYERESGKEKVLLSVPGSSALPAFDAWRQISGQVSHLLAIDTNTREVSGRRVSVTFACRITERLPTRSRTLYFSPLCAYAILDVVPGVNPERIGWHLVLSKHVNLGLVPDSERLGLVVDSELGLLGAMNQRKEGYYGTHLLPDRILMLYASDSTAETLPASMIRYCHTSADRLLDYIEENTVQFPEIRREDDPNYACHFSIAFRHS